MTHYLQERALFPPLIAKRPSPLLGIIVVIPCHDEDFLLLSLLALKRCKRPNCDVEVIIVINHSETAPAKVVKKNQDTRDQALRWIRENRVPHIRFHLLYQDALPSKRAGVGLARKIGMDEACYRFHKAGNQSGIIACFDADSRCEPNYFQALEGYFNQRPKAQACGIHFEHPLSGCEFDDDIYDAITLYELHLRYYIHAQRWAGFPHAWQTIGSSMAVRCDAYQRQGGMNRRQAGEDFYFLQKFIPLGHFGEITSTKVIPSPRPSHRVPFGTGKAVNEILRSGRKYLTYNPESFVKLRIFLTQQVPGLYEKWELNELDGTLPACVSQFLKNNHFEAKMAEIQAHTSTGKNFIKRFWRWFDAFMVMKYIHFAREHFYPDIDIVEAANWMIKKESPAEAITEATDPRSLLEYFRQADKSYHEMPVT